MPEEEEISEEEEVQEAELTEIEDDIPEEMPEDISEDESSNMDNIDVEKQPVDDIQDSEVEEAAIDVDSEDTGEQSVDDIQDNVVDGMPIDGNDEIIVYNSVDDTEKTNDILNNNETANSLSDYMNSHNYGLDDFATYSQDPEWRKLQKQAYPDYELPPLTQENARNQLIDYMNANSYGLDDFETYSQDPKWRELQRQAYPDYELPPLNKLDNLGQWSEVPPDLSYKDNLEAANPNYELSDEWKVNCQRCVPTYEMRSRGYDVTAFPCVDNNDYLSYHPYDVWESPDVRKASGNGLHDIQDLMSSWGDGSRAQVCLQWDVGEGGHTFMAEQRNGKTYFVDPQTGDTDVSWYFDEAKPGSVSFCRTDQLMPSSRILNCCKGVKK